MTDKLHETLRTVHQDGVTLTCSYLLPVDLYCNTDDDGTTTVLIAGYTIYLSGNEGRIGAILSFIKMIDAVRQFNPSYPYKRGGDNP